MSDFELDFGDFEEETSKFEAPKCEDALSKIKREIAELRASMHLSEVEKDKRREIVKEFGHEYAAKTKAAYDAYLVLVDKLNEEKRKLEAEFAKMLREFEDSTDLLKQKERELAALMELEYQRDYLTKLKGELDEICLEFPSYFKAHIYQHEDLLFIFDAYNRGTKGVLNANGMGLGKTFEATLSAFVIQQKFAQEHGKKPKILWLTKKSLVHSSPTEIKKWWPEVTVITPTKNNSVKDREFSLEMYLMFEADIFLCNYEFIRTTPTAANMTWDLIVIDEVHKLKGGANVNGPTQIWTAIKDVCTRSRFTHMMSGTPMVNRPEEMWSYLHILKPAQFPSMKQFNRDFCFFKDNELVVDAERLLRMGLKGQMVRRTADEVGMQLPDLNREIIQLEMNPKQREVYDQLRTRFFIWLNEQEGKALTATSILAQLTRLRQINVWPSGIKLTDSESGAVMHVDVPDSSKIDEALDIIENAGDEQVVLFCTFNEPMNEVQRRVRAMGKRCEVISGANVNEMGSIERAFQQKQVDVLCINSAMGEGLNLQKNPEFWPGGSRIAIFLDLWYSPARNEQCEARIYRQGATHAVSVYILENDRSVDAFIMERIMKKNAAFGKIMDSEAIRPVSEWRSFLEGLL